MPGFSPIITVCRCICGLDNGRPSTVGSVVLPRVLTICQPIRTAIIVRQSKITNRRCLFCRPVCMCLCVFETGADDGCVDAIRLLKALLKYRLAQSRENSCSDNTVVPIVNRVKSLPQTLHNSSILERTCFPAGEKTHTAT